MKNSEYLVWAVQFILYFMKIKKELLELDRYVCLFLRLSRPGEPDGKASTEGQLVQLLHLPADFWPKERLLAPRG